MAQQLTGHAISSTPLYRRIYPSPFRRQPKPSDWGIGMTVCIGAISGDGEIVMVSDRLMSLSDFSVDTVAVKIQHIHADWAALFATDDASVVPLILREIGDSFADSVGNWNVKVPIDVVIACLRSGFQRARQQRASDLYLSPLGLSLDTFYQDGPSRLGKTQFALVRQAVEQANLNTRLLVCGFDDCDLPHVLTIDDPGVVGEHDVIGYWAVGSGAYQALGSLAFRRHSKAEDTISTLYNLCEAKFAAESAPGVGVDTVAVIQRGDRSTTTVGKNQIQLLRSEWETIGRPRPLTGATKRKIQQAIDSTVQQAREKRAADHNQSSKRTNSSTDQT